MLTSRKAECHYIVEPQAQGAEACWPVGTLGSPGREEKWLAVPRRGPSNG